MIAVSVFGYTPEGEPVRMFTISHDHLRIEILEWGCIVKSLKYLIDNDWREVCLGYDTLEEYFQDKFYTGAVVGRVANRISKAQFTLDSKVYQLSLNEPPHHLHGGFAGWHARKWNGEIKDDEVHLTLTDQDGVEGYPGNLKASVVYKLTEEALCITFSAETDSYSVWNPTFHGYFNLDDSETILDHKLQIRAHQYLSTKDDRTPTGKIQDVDKSGYDLNEERSIGEILEEVQRLDTSFISGAKSDELLAILSGKDIVMEVLTDALTIHVYDGEGLLPQPYRGICLETQGYADAVNHPHFPTIEIRKGKTYKASSIFRFIKK